MKSVWATQIVIERIEVSFLKTNKFDVYVYHIFKPEINDFKKYTNTDDIKIMIKSPYIQNEIIIDDLNKRRET